MNRDLIFNTIPYSVGVAGGFILLIAPFFRRTKASGSRHYRVALFFAGITTIGWATLGLLDAPLHPHLTKHAHYLLHHYKDMCAGAAISILLLEFVSGELLAAYRRDKELRRQRTDATPLSSNDTSH